MYLLLTLVESAPVESVKVRAAKYPITLKSFLVEF